MMKNLICICSLLFILAACSKEDELTNLIDLSSPYVITEDDPSNPVQHRVYEIYKKYAVPVFFTDTIQKTLFKYDNNGNPVYKYETLDMKWTFSSYQQDAEYTIAEYETEEEMLKALDFVEFYLGQISAKMRPFCIYSVKSFQNGDRFPDYMTGFRILLLPGIADIEDTAKRQELCTSMVKSMVLDKVKQNNVVVARFTNVSQKNKWYGLKWKGTAAEPGLACSYKYTAASWVLDPIVIWSDDEVDLEFMRDVFDRLCDEGEEFSVDEMRRNITKDIGQYGFISGSRYSPAYNSPDNSTVDLEVFVNMMIALKDAGFKARYGECPLVMQKYNILYDYIVKELEVKL